MGLVPWTVALPLVVAAFLAAAGRHLSRRAADIVALLATIAVSSFAAVLLLATRHAPLVTWFGGWKPRGNVALGIAFVVEPFGAALALLAGLLVTAALVFSIRFFDPIHGHFHALVLVFLGGICGFALTADLFNLFVMFELMGAAAFALCGYKAEEPAPLQGAMNFAVTNTVAAVLMLFGIGLLYGRTGALNMAEVARSLGTAHDPLVIVALALLLSGLFVKAAIVPFHLWLPDAHAVSPSPVSVLFSGVMVEAALFAAVRLCGLVFDDALAGGSGALRTILLAFGSVTAVVGAVSSVMQVHLKRLLAFSTVSHMGIVLCGVAVLEPRGVAGALTYALGHGLVKGALFLLSGVLLHRFRTVNELRLYGRGRGMSLVGAAFLVAGLALAGAPMFLLARGDGLVHESLHASGAWLAVGCTSVASVLTGAAVLRATFRIFLGLGARESALPITGAQDEAPETGGSAKVPWTMLAPPVLLLVLAAAAAFVPELEAQARAHATTLLDAKSHAALVLDGVVREVAPVAAKPSSPLKGTLQALLSIVLAAAILGRRRVPKVVRHEAARLGTPVVWGLREWHSGHVGDYVAWLVFGAAALGALCLAFVG